MRRTTAWLRRRLLQIEAERDAILDELACRRGKCTAPVWVRRRKVHGLRCGQKRQYIDRPTRDWSTVTCRRCLKRHLRDRQP